MTTAIEDYAIIGDCRSAALVSRAGSMDWLCWPRFDSPSLFGALLDPERGGFWTIAPRGLRARGRGYLEETAVLRTTFADEASEVVLTDLMPIVSPDEARTLLTPEHELLRVVECTRGEATVEVHFEPRPRFGQCRSPIRNRGKLGFWLETPDGLLMLRTDTPAPSMHGDSLHFTFVLSAGQAVHFSLTFTVDAPAVLPPLGDWTAQRIDRTVEHWRTWSSRTRYEGADRSLVSRSAITVRLLAYAPSGAIVAAPTTSLPETLGGSLNWDYRYCWLRDAAFSVRSFLGLGHDAEAGAYAHWLLHATRLTQPRLGVLYDVFGRTPERERELSGLSGYGGSKPVRVGNGADDQVQLDSYGEVIDAVWQLTRAGVPLDRETCDVLESFGRFVCEHWTEPDAGIWEPRGAARHHTHSLSLCWTGLDRLVDLQNRGEMRPRHRDLFASHRRRIEETLRSRAYDERVGSYTAELDGTSLDATSLLLGWFGFEDPSSARMRSTCARVCESLSPRPGLLYRYRSPKDQEGAFGICSFWLAEHLARGGGTLSEARRSFEATTAFASDVGLFAEQIDPPTGRALGNFPQTFTHVGLINAALSLAEREKRDGGAST